MKKSAELERPGEELQALSIEIDRRYNAVGGGKLKVVERLGWFSVAVIGCALVPALIVTFDGGALLPRIVLLILLAGGLAGLLVWYVRVRTTVSKLNSLFSMWQRYSGVQGEIIDRLKQIDRTKKTMMNMASHQMRAPLAAIQSCLRVLMSGAVKEKADVDKLMGDAYGRGEDMMDLINDMLRLAEAKVDAARRVDEIDVEKAVRKIAQFFSVRAAEKNVDIRVVVGTPPGYLRADRRMFDHVVLNLISNAFRYSDPGKPIIIYVFRSDDTVKVRVTDWGIVIKPDEMEHIFKEFWRSPEAVKRVYRGTGLGLPIVKDIVDSLGGAIDVKSDEVNGTLFTVSIPVI